MKIANLPGKYQKVIDELYDRNIIFDEQSMDMDLVESVYNAGYDPEDMMIILEKADTEAALYTVSYPFIVTSRDGEVRLYRNYIEFSLNEVGVYDGMTPNKDNPDHTFNINDIEGLIDDMYSRGLA